MANMEFRAPHMFWLFYKYKDEIDQRFKDTIVCMLGEKDSNDDTTTANTIEDTVSNCGVLFKI